MREFFRKLFTFLFPAAPSDRICDMCGKRLATVAKTADYAICEYCDAEGNAI